MLPKFWRDTLEFALGLVVGILAFALIAAALAGGF